MRYRSWLLLPVALGGMACGNHYAAVAPPPPPPPINAGVAAPPPPLPTYDLEISFVGLVGYYNDGTGVWALLPKARQGSLLPTGIVDPSYYPDHYAVLEVNGANVKGFGVPIEIQIPIDGYEIKLPQGMVGGTGNGLTGQEFKFVPDPMYATSEKLNQAVLATPAPDVLSARMQLPLTDLVAMQGLDPFENVHPSLSGKTCREPDQVPHTNPRVESVVWTRKNLSGDFVLTFQPLDGSASTGGLTLVPVPASGPLKVTVSILNQVSDALYDPSILAKHWAAYRWFYNLSDPPIRADCSKHYYPQGPAGGNRCPQKLYN
jgi:hypothetical protein